MDYEKLTSYNDYLSQFKDFTSNKKLNFDKTVKIIKKYESYSELQQDIKLVNKFRHSINVLNNDKNYVEI